MKIFFALISFTCFSVSAQQYVIDGIDTDTNSHFRGLSVIDNTSAWISGGKGTIGRSTDGGKKWQFQRLKDHENLDFRSLYAFDSLTAIIANAGSPAYIFRTNDGGRSWSTVYTNNNEDIFIDGVDFWNDKEGMIYGDAIEGRMLLLRTEDGGKTWHEIPPAQRPALAVGEMSFAASGTGIRCLGTKKIVIATGGKHSRLWVSNDKGNTWASLEPPIIQGETMTGIFSVAFSTVDTGIIVGGNYEKDTLRTDHVFYTNNSGKSWKRPHSPTRGIMECVEYINKTDVIATGKPGVDISRDGGKTWQKLSDENLFSVVRKARKGSLIIMGGAKGRIAIVTTRR